MSARDGKPCVRCGSNEWYKSGDCVPCARLRVKRYIKNNRERVKEARRKQYQKNREDNIRKAGLWQQQNQDKHRTNSIRYYRNNKDKCIQSARRWTENNRDKVNAMGHRRRVKARQPNSYTVKQWEKLCKEYNYRCLACGKKRPLTVDHVVPIALGGTNGIDNIQPLCGPCNSSKGTNIIDYRTKPSIKRWIQKRLL